MSSGPARRTERRWPGSGAAFWLCISLLFPFALAAALPEVISPEVAPVLKQASPDDEISVIVTFETTLDLDSITGRDKSARRLNATRALRDDYARQAGPHERFLRARQAPRIVPLWILNGMAVTASAKTIEELATRPGVATIRPDSSIQGPETTPGLTDVAEWNLESIRADAVWAHGHTGAGIVIANLDSGVDIDHPDFAAQWRGGANSWFDPFGQYAEPHDNTTGHGTQVNGILVGGNAGGSSIGVAPGAQWIAARIFDNDNRSSVSAIHRAFQWVLDPDENPATDDAPDIVNCSWGLREEVGECVMEFAPDILALRAAEIAVVFAAGNEGPNPSTDLSPANNPGALSIGSIGQAMAIEYNSSRGPSACFGKLFPRIVAPGVDVRTADLTFGGLFPNSYTTVSGTSFSAPHVSGAMALLLGAFPETTVTELELALEKTAVDLGAPGPDNEFGYGLIDIEAAFRRLRHFSAVPRDRFLLYR